MSSRGTLPSRAAFVRASSALSEFIPSPPVLCVRTSLGSQASPPQASSSWVMHFSSADSTLWRPLRCVFFGRVGCDAWFSRLGMTAWLQGQHGDLFSDSTRNTLLNIPVKRLHGLDWTSNMWRGHPRPTEVRSGSEPECWWSIKFEGIIRTGGRERIYGAKPIVVTFFVS